MLRSCDRLGPASAVSVLFRSRGASNPARYSPNPRRCANEPNRSSNGAAYSSSGPGAAGHGRRRGITHPTAGHATTPWKTADPFGGQQTTVRRRSPERDCLSLDTGHRGARSPMPGARACENYALRDGRGLLRAAAEREPA
jgi:hypothetical protein